VKLVSSATIEATAPSATIAEFALELTSSVVSAANKPSGPKELPSPVVVMAALELKLPVRIPAHELQFPGVLFGTVISIS
jgi:hypothetical protein